MAGDLGAHTRQVHAEAEAVLHFWLEEVPPEKRFARDDALDAECARRFKALRDRLAATAAAGLRDDPRHLLGAVIALDQFSRNIYRGSAEAFAADPIARSLSEHALREGWDRGMSIPERQFLYMPFQHSEDAADQDRSVALFTALGDGKSLDYATLHRDVIRRFGRFPGRNAALGRPNTSDEEAFLAEDQAF
ncbi:DUF924 family protein [Sphingomonas sp. MAH-20]|uniref:DUF924 family protein n=1 Tax=Sphingomonas horti TaxID=2682842 RepID=A0A6I4J1X4_9SPHN|nr:MULTISPECIES: DUF924 family protein [Sphingomonas]MBA2919844.1 DUF924 domain-containing protein [Sphingomonas sp. CGMCC 1.13658]MVO78083.1 DUF924 family protein [Sphingomonas horti]